MLSSNLTATIEVDSTQLPVVDYSLEQEVDQIDSLYVSIDAARDVEVSTPDEYLDKVVKFALTDDQTKESRYFHGVVWDVGFSEDDDGAARLELTVYPELVKLAHRFQSRIYMDQSVQDIVKEVIERAGLTTKVRWELSKTPETLDYCAQYEETDLEFMSRILAREGISWFWHEGEDESELIVCDEVAKYQAGQAQEVPFLQSFGHQASRSIITHVEQTELVTPDAVQVSGFDPHRPSLKIEASNVASVEGAGQDEIYFPLTNRPSPERAQRVAELTLQGYQCRRRTVYGESASHLFSIGGQVKISGHPLSALNDEYLVTRLRHTAIRETEFSTRDAQTVQRIEFWASPVSHGFFPRRQIHKPHVSGVQTAITTGEAGDDIHTNEHGESTVHFHWDRVRPHDQDSSRFMRTAQLPTGGSMLLPRVGWEVTIMYLEGDVDEPMVLSRLYNGATMPPYALPENALRSSLQTATTPGDGSSNEIRMSDVKGEEQMMFNASKDMSVDVGNNTTQSVGNDLSVKVGANHQLTVIDSFTSTVGANQSVAVSGNRTQNVTALLVEDVGSDHKTTIGGNLTQMIGGDLRRTLAATSELEIGGNCLTATIGSVTLDVGAGYDHKVDAACVEIVKGSRSVMVGAAKTETTGGAKIIMTQSSRAVEAGVLNTTIGGAMLVKADGDRSIKAKTAFAETAGGMEKVEAKNITIEGQASVTLTMGGAIISITPASISVTGANVTVDGNLIQVSPMNMNN